MKLSFLLVAILSISLIGVIGTSYAGMSFERFCEIKSGGDTTAADFICGEFNIEEINRKVNQNSRVYEEGVPGIIITQDKLTSNTGVFVANIYETTDIIGGVYFNFQILNFFNGTSITEVNSTIPEHMNIKVEWGTGQMGSDLTYYPLCEYFAGEVFDEANACFTPSIHTDSYTNTVFLVTVTTTDLPDDVREQRLFFHTFYNKQ